MKYTGFSLIIIKWKSPKMWICLNSQSLLLISQWYTNGRSNNGCHKQSSFTVWTSHTKLYDVIGLSLPFIINLLFPIVDMERWYPKHCRIYDLWLPESKTNLGYCWLFVIAWCRSVPLYLLKENWIFESIYLVVAKGLLQLTWISVVAHMNWCFDSQLAEFYPRWRQYVTLTLFSHWHYSTMRVYIHQLTTLCSRWFCHCRGLLKPAWAHWSQILAWWRPLQS